MKLKHIQPGPLSLVQESWGLDLLGQVALKCWNIFMVLLGHKEPAQGMQNGTCILCLSLVLYKYTYVASVSIQWKGPTLLSVLDIQWTSLDTFIWYNVQQRQEIYCLQHSTVCTVRTQNVIWVFSPILLNPGNLYVIILFTTSCGWKWVEVSKLRVWGL